MADEHHDEAKHSKGHGGGGHGGGHGAHGGGGGHEEHEGAPEWLISFADNVALMMGFFVILLAMNMKPASAGGATESGDGQPSAANQAEMLDFAIALREAFNNPVDAENPSPGDLALARRIRERETEKLARSPGQKGYENEVRSITQSKNYSNGGIVHFPRGSAEMDDLGRREFTELAKHRKGMLRNVVVVRGHVSAAEAYGSADRGMRLSYERAHAVAAALVEAGLSWDQLRVAACGASSRAVQASYDELGHSANQRVEVIETDDALIRAGEVGVSERP